MITKSRMFFASLASAAAFVVVPAVGCFLAIQTPYVKLDSTPDNAPIRAVGMLIVISPAVFVSVLVLTFALAVLLQRLKQLRPTVLAGVVIIMSLGLGFAMVLDRSFGWRDALYYFVGFALSVFVTMSVTTLVWWKVATRRDNAGDSGTR